jgi:hypothetical protein
LPKARQRYIRKNIASVDVEAEEVATLTRTLGRLSSPPISRSQKPADLAQSEAR